MAQPIFADFIIETMKGYLYWLDSHTDDDNIPLGLEKSVKKATKFLTNKKILCNSGIDRRHEVNTLIAS